MSGGGDTTTKVKLTPEQKQLLGIALPGLADTAANPPSPFPSTSSIAPFDPLQVAGQEAAVGAVPQVDQLGQNAATGTNFLTGFGLPTGAAGAAAQVGQLAGTQPGLDFILSGGFLDPNTNPYLAATAEGAIRPLQQQLTEQILPALDLRSLDRGQFGSSRQGIAQGRAAEGFFNAAGDVTSDIFNNAYQRGLDQFLAAISGTQQSAGQGAGNLLEQGVRGLFGTPTIQQSLLQPANILDAVGALRQGQSQALLTEEAQRFQLEQYLQYLLARDVAGIAFGAPSGVQTTASAGGGGVGGAATGALGGAATGATIGTAVLGPGTGTGIGAVGGGLVGLLSGLFA